MGQQWKASRIKTIFTRLVRRDIQRPLVSHPGEPWGPGEHGVLVPLAVMVLAEVVPTA